MDTTAMAGCKNPTIHPHKIFAGLAERGKTPTVGFLAIAPIEKSTAAVDFKLTKGMIHAYFE
jgi:hypothetical protein